jgi:hypothetical protein
MSTLVFTLSSPSKQIIKFFFFLIGKLHARPLMLDLTLYPIILEDLMFELELIILRKLGIGTITSQIRIISWYIFQYMVIHVKLNFVTNPDCSF